jgi:hypothetical protein
MDETGKSPFNIALTYLALFLLGGACGIGGYIFYNKRIEEAKTQAKKEVTSDSKS